MLLHEVLSNHLLWLIVTLICFDFVTGGSKAIALKEVSSSIGLRGIIKHINVLLAAVFVVCLNFFIRDEITGFSLNIILLFIIYNYLVSVVENLIRIGVPIPKFIAEYLKEEEQKINENQRNDN